MQGNIEYEHRPNEKRAQHAITLIWLVTVSQIISVLLNFIDESYVNQNEIAENDYATTAFYLMLSVVSFGFIGIAIISYVTFIMWFRRAYYNLHQQVGVLSYGEGWAAGAWFVPIMNLFVPYKIMKELYNYTNRLFQQKTGSTTLPLNFLPLKLWWALWLITKFIDNVSMRAFFQGDQYGISTPLDFVSAALGLPLAYITVKIIRDYTAVDSSLEKMNMLEKIEENKMNSYV